MIPQKYIAMLLLMCAFLLPAAPALADGGPSDSIVDKVGFDQRLNEQVPFDLMFHDETGALVRFGSYFGTKPVVLMLGYLGCPNLCSIVSKGMVASFNQLAFNIGEQFNVVSVSIDPRETPDIAATKKTEYLRDYNRPNAEKGWHFLTGEEAAIARLARAVGYRYAFDPQIDQYAHPAGLVVITPKGKISRYFYGVEYNPNDLRLGLVEASSDKIGTPIDSFLLRCYHYDVTTGKYSLQIMNVLQITGIVTVFLLGGALFMLARHNRRPQVKV
jgi:protein SCO1/2